MTEPSALTVAVRAALDTSDLSSATSGVKNAVCDELARIDPSATIRKTDYFNHSYVPDVVAEWPDRSVREVFLRFIDPHRLAEDVARIGEKGPMLVDLSAAAPSSPVVDYGERSEAIELGVSKRPRVLITDTEATEHIRPAEAHNMVERLITSNLLRAGRGQVTEDVAEVAVATAREGFEGANRLDPVAVSAAMNVTARLLGDDLQQRVAKTLQLLWWAGGGEPDDFPSAHLDDMELNPTDAGEFLRLVLSGDEIEDDEFWRRLAQRVDFDTLGIAGDVAGSANLDRLMRLLAHELPVSHAAVDIVPPSILEPALSWCLNDRFVQLNGPGWTCRMTPKGNRFPPRHGAGEPISLATAQARSEEFIVEETEIEEPGRRVSYARLASTPVHQPAATLGALTLGVSTSARLRKLVVRRLATRLEADFGRMLLASNPDSSVDQMAFVSVSLLTSQANIERADLQHFLGL